MQRYLERAIRTSGIIAGFLTSTLIFATPPAHNNNEHSIPTCSKTSCNSPDFAKNCGPNPCSNYQVGDLYNQFYKLDRQGCAFKKKWPCRAPSKSATGQGR